ncbi:MAG: type II toxin-antitoxin system HicB family antitoxin [Thermodesulfobacteriota bacterium]|nr:type II toxin-antitoxin system HicB family antitoxin [Thermodesulfobacteriota bacterium]
MGETKQETIELISEAIEFHIEGLYEDGNRIPIPHCKIAYVEVANI